MNVDLPYVGTIGVKELLTAALPCILCAWLFSRARQQAYHARLPKLTWLDVRLAVVRLPADIDKPLDLPGRSQFYSVTRTADETSVVVEERLAPKASSTCKVETGCAELSLDPTTWAVSHFLTHSEPEVWRSRRDSAGIIFKLEGPLDFALIGILSRIATILAKVGISIFAMSTYDTDYVLLKAEHKAATAAVLRKNGYTLNN